MGGGHVAVAVAEFFTMIDSLTSALALGSLTAIINMITRTTTRMTAPPDPMRGIFTESNVSRIDDEEICSIGSIEILLLINFVSLILIFSSSHLCSTISIL